MGAIQIEEAIRNSLLENLCISGRQGMSQWDSGNHRALIPVFVWLTRLLKVLKWVDSVKMNVWLIIVSAVGRCTEKYRIGGLSRAVKWLLHQFWKGSHTDSGKDQRVNGLDFSATHSVFSHQLWHGRTRLATHDTVIHEPGYILIIFYF